MKKAFFMTGVLGVALMAGSICHAENWVKKEFTSKVVEANYEDADSVKMTKDKAIHWSEKFVLTEEGRKNYNRHLSTFKGCKEAITKKGDVAYHVMDYEIKDGKYRHLAKRNYNKNNELVCTDKEMDKSVDMAWHRIGRKSPMEDTYYNLVTKYKLKDQ